MLHIIESLRPSGQASQAGTLCTGLAERGFAVHVAALRDGPMNQTLAAAGVQVHLTPRRHRFDPFVVRRLRQIAREVRPATVHAWDAASTAFAHAAGLGPIVASVAEGGNHAAGWPSFLGRRVDQAVAKHLAASE
ncbi:MAG: glycosyltransferase, partial [Planctomycetota bacterium]